MELLSQFVRLCVVPTLLGSAVALAIFFSTNLTPQNALHSLVLVGSFGPSSPGDSLPPRAELPAEPTQWVTTPGPENVTSDEKVRIFHDAVVGEFGHIFLARKMVDTPIHDCGAGYKHKVPNAASCHGPAHALVVLTTSQSEMFFHFYAESLSRVMWVHQQHPELLKSPRTLYHTTCVDARCNGLAALLGIQTRVGTGTHLVAGCWTARLVAWPPSSLGCSSPRVPALRSMNLYLRRSLIDQGVKDQAGQKPIAILIRRRTDTVKKRSARVIENIVEVLTEVRRAGWDVKVFDAKDQLDAEAQCRLFHSASLVVGAHGAGFTNMLCACPGTTILEIRQSTDGYNQVFLRLASALGLKYTGLPTNPPFSLPYSGVGFVNATLVGEAAAQVLLDVHQGRSVRRCAPEPSTL